MSLIQRATRFGIIAVLVGGVLGSCGGSASTSKLTAVAIDSGVKPNEHGFSFANFGSDATAEYLNSEDLVTMFGGGACVGGITTPCTPTAQASAWAKMVNESRASGHCEGLAVQAATRFDSKATPVTESLTNAGDVTHGIIRAFATQFLPEVQDATEGWAKKSLVDIVNELSTSFVNKNVSYTMGLYTSTGGHAVLPYAIEFPKPDLAIVKVYDSNWPGMERYVSIDLATKVWTFSFSGENPLEDADAWSGKVGDIDITPMGARTSTSLNWSVKTTNGTYSPSSSASVAGVRSRTLRSASSTSQVKVPEYILYTDAEDFELQLPDTSSAYVSNGDSVVQVAATGSKVRKPILFKKNIISVEDNSTTLTVSSDNVVAQVTSNLANIKVGARRLSIDLGGKNAPINVNEANPQIVVRSDKNSPPVITKATNLVTVVPSIVPALKPPDAKPGLSAPSSRDLSNPNYAAIVEKAPTGPVTAPSMSTGSTVAAKPTPSSIASTPAPTTQGTKAPLSESTTTIRATTATIAPPTTVARATATIAPPTTVARATATTVASATTVRATPTTVTSTTVSSTNPPTKPK